MCALEQYLNERNIPLTSLEANSINEGVEWGLEKACEYLRTHLWENKDPDGGPIVESVHNITKENFIKDIKRYVFETKSQPKKIKQWVARDEYGMLWLFDKPPVLRDKNIEGFKYSWFDMAEDGIYNYQLNYENFPEVTFENSPQEIEINLVKRC